MKSKLRSYLISISGWFVLITTVFFFIVLKVFQMEGVTKLYKETLTISVGFLSALATFGAAIIAARLFQTWKTQHNYVEQIRILGQMIETIDSISFTIVEARINDNLEKILQRQPYTQPLSEAFSEQKKNAKFLENLICKLAYLQNQIYLLRNDNIGTPVFTKDDEDNCPLSSLAEIITDIQVNIDTTHEYLASDMKNGRFTFIKLDLRKKDNQEMILNILFSRDSTLRMAVPESYDSKGNFVNLNIKECIKVLNNRVMNYRDSLDTLN